MCYRVFSIISLDLNLWDTFKQPEASPLNTKKKRARFDHIMHRLRVERGPSTDGHLTKLCSPISLPLHIDRFLSDTYFPQPGEVSHRQIIQQTRIYVYLQSPHLPATPLQTLRIKPFPRSGTAPAAPCPPGAAAERERCKKESAVPRHSDPREMPPHQRSALNAGRGAAPTTRYPPRGRRQSQRRGHGREWRPHPRRAGRAHDTPRRRRTELRAAAPPTTPPSTTRNVGQERGPPQKRTPLEPSQPYASDGDEARREKE
ncbi:hypothetical protein C8J57DRAFT_1212590 [Mycena rebaudengoi]|nr:hypothetical protein C8J57DRAFT_1212590 [Mycena rebaudengoi]